MPRKSPYEIVLSQSEAKELAARSQKYTLPYFQVQRVKIVLLAAEGLANNKIAKRLDTRREVRNRGISAQISDKTVWRWLHEGAIRPWQHRTWIFPRDPQFVKAGRVLDLYERRWNGAGLKEDEFVISADEKTSIQARKRCHKTLPCLPGFPMKVEHEYKRCGAWA